MYNVFHISKNYFGVKIHFNILWLNRRSYQFPVKIEKYRKWSRQSFMTSILSNFA